MPYVIEYSLTKLLKFSADQIFARSVWDMLR